MAGVDATNRCRHEDTGTPLESIGLEAARTKIRELSDSLGAAQVEISNRGERLASARSVLSDTEHRLHEEIARADEATEEANLIATHSTTLIEANEELRRRVRRLGGVLVLCQGHFAAQGQMGWAEEAARVLRGEKA